MTRPNTTNFEFGDVILVSFLFTDQRHTKQRPTVVISSLSHNQQRPDIILMAITSRLREPPEFVEHFIEGSSEESVGKTWFAMNAKPMI